MKVQCKITLNVNRRYKPDGDLPIYSKVSAMLKFSMRSSIFGIGRGVDYLK